MSSDSLDNWARGVMSGQTRGLGATALRGLLRAIEPGYAGVAAIRNRLFDRGLKQTHRLDRPVISVGNLTTGGTGKTPFVQWLVRELQTLGHQPAVLMRGYAKADAAAESDEQRVLRESLPGCPVYANPDRVAAGQRALAEQPAISVFVLDDGFQHRRLTRDIDTVLIDATNPFGYDHVLPRGMLRERPSGLSRANLVVITRTERVAPSEVEAIADRVHRWTEPGTPVVAVRYVMDEVRIGSGPPIPLRSMAGRRVFAISAIGNPHAFEAGLADVGLNIVGSRRFADHHAYNQADVDACLARARSANAELLATTEKDWAKLRELRCEAMPVARVSVRVEATQDLRQFIATAVPRRA